MQVPRDIIPLGSRGFLRVYIHTTKITKRLGFGRVGVTTTVSAAVKIHSCANSQFEITSNDCKKRILDIQRPIVKRLSKTTDCQTINDC